MDLFIDTNVLLSFYHFQGDDLEELKKLIVLVEQKKLQLYLPSQVVSEFRRNREAKIGDAIRRLKEQRLNLQFPQICKDYPEYVKLRGLQNTYEAQHTALLNRLNDDARNHALKADAIISQLFRLAKGVACADAVVRRARDRSDLGNPPGKDGSLGDAVNWEALLGAVPEETDLHFITDDNDYCSALDKEAFSGFLSEEWWEKKKSNLIFYRRISAFFKEHFPDIKLATELEKDLLIEELTSSSSFVRTHAVIRKLSKYTDFTPAQLNAIVSAAVANSQVKSIIDDVDVRQFLSGVVRGRETLVEKDTLDLLQSLMSPPKKEHVEGEDFPF
jgi:predicted nucleic acid-binding protein